MRILLGMLTAEFAMFWQHLSDLRHFAKFAKFSEIRQTCGIVADFAGQNFCELCGVLAKLAKFVNFAKFGEICGIVCGLRWAEFL